LHRVVGAAIAAAALSVSVGARAQSIEVQTPAPVVAPSTAVEATDADIRTAWIQSRIDAERPAAQRWFWGFMAFDAATAAVGFTFGAVATDRDEQGNRLPPADRSKPSLYMGGIVSALGVGGLLVTPLRPAFTGDELRDLPARSPEERIARARRAEELLRACAESERSGRSWVPHVLGGVVAVGSAMILWLGFHQPWYRVVTSFAATSVGSELQIITRPTQLIHDWEAYERDGWRTLAARRARPKTRVTPLAYPGGAGLSVEF
jgi:hypothetical protein